MTASFTREPSWRRLLAANHIYWIAVFVFLVMSLTAPYFFTSRNLTIVMKGMCLSLPAAIGFTIVLITGKLDLSIGTTLTLGGIVTVGFQPQLGWAGSLPLGVLCGVAVGVFNGFLVARAKVDSFIATLGTMIVTQGLIFIYCEGGTLTVEDFRVGNWMETPFVPLLTPRVVLAVGLTILIEFLLLCTRIGRNVYLIGGSASTAWSSGVPVDRYIMGAFVVSGGLAAFGGALFAIGINSATPTMGNNVLMEVVAAVIIGGTAMSGGRGSVLKSMIALLALTMLYNGLECMGAGWEARKISAGVVLAAVVLYDASLSAYQRRIRGQRHELMEEAERLLDEADSEPETDSEETERNETMQRKDNTLPLVIVGVVGCVAIVAIFAMYLNRQQPVPVIVSGVSNTTSPVAATNDLLAEAAAKEIEVSQLKSGDGQPLILPEVTKTVPPRPVDPKALPKEDAGHWYDMEYSGWSVVKVNQPDSPADGPRGKRVVYLKAIDHPYLTAMVVGMEKVAGVYGIEMSYKVANNDINIQAQQVDQVINERPDLVVVSPVDAQACTPSFRRLNEAGIPCIAINLLPAQEAHKYILTWTGPDDWQQFRLLTATFAKYAEYKGGYCVVQHWPGSSPFFSRTWSAITELEKIAPEMKLLALQTTGLESEKTKDVVSGWITRFGSELNGIVCADDSGAQIGINEAVKNAGREDIVRVAAGNSKVGMDFVKAGNLHAITYQSAEADGAVPLKLAADWFYGKPIPPMRYLPIAIITEENVERYMPAQW